MAQFIALSSLHLPHPSGEGNTVSHYSDGDPFLRPKILIVKPGASVEIENERIITRLLRQGAICTPEEHVKLRPEARTPHRFPWEGAEGIFDDQGKLVDPNYGEPAYHTEDRSTYLPAPLHLDAVVQCATTGMIAGLVDLGFEVTLAQRDMIRELALREFWGGKPLAEISKPASVPGWGHNPQQRKSLARERRNQFMLLRAKRTTWESLLNRLKRNHNTDRSALSLATEAVNNYLEWLSDPARKDSDSVPLAAKALSDYVNYSEDPELWPGARIKASSIRTAYLAWENLNHPEVAEARISSAKNRGDGRVEACIRLNVKKVARRMAGKDT